jgi:hypothetical protein
MINLLMFGEKEYIHRVMSPAYNIQKKQDQER